MRMRTSIAFVALVAMAGTAPNLAQAVTISTVPIGNPNNTADGSFGAVAYAFEMGKYEVTNAQYVDFLNAVAKTDTYGLFATSPDTPSAYGITRSGSSGSYTYAVKAAGNGGTYDYTNKPVCFVSVGDAMRFANWMNNGQPTGAQGLSTTEDGAYYLNGANTAAALQSVTRKAGATWWLPNENEWYKAAYYNPNTSTYYSYPTSSDTAPTKVSPPGSNSANWGQLLGTSYPHTNVGAYTSAASPYGTFDQGGNVFEWNETLVPSSTARVGRGGSYWHAVSYLNKANTYGGGLGSNPDFEYSSVGFRLATVPEPSSLAMLLFGSIMLWAVGRKGISKL